ncbi:hypothetical protein FVE85_6472 [Porphyridium purpureum]|uniref:Uncharacterized protein n=1 Tax=Porphyridium purpureum TaxID=35688 RepID=A0A5J4Z864_PORPP|nr:hypothetical protein FVE85_6472 [Porphyridium purpureum]|eukprot:POR8502..scf295_1
MDASRKEGHRDDVQSPNPHESDHSFKRMENSLMEMLESRLTMQDHVPESLRAAELHGGPNSRRPSILSPHLLSPRQSRDNLATAARVHNREEPNSLGELASLSEEARLARIHEKEQRDEMKNSLRGGSRLKGITSGGRLDASSLQAGQSDALDSSRNNVNAGSPDEGAMSPRVISSDPDEQLSGTPSGLRKHSSLNSFAQKDGRSSKSDIGSQEKHASSSKLGLGSLFKRKPGT